MSEINQYRDVFHHAMKRDSYKCVYCDKYMMESLDSFASIDLDHLVPRKSGGSNYSRLNRVISCRVCNGLKQSFSPAKAEPQTEDEFHTFVKIAREYVQKKRSGVIANEHFKNFRIWTERLLSNSSS